MNDAVLSPSRPRRTRRALFAACGVAVVAAALIGVLATRSVAPQASVSSALLGHRAPEISGKDIAGGKTVNLTTLRGRFVVLAFFASWCAPCTQEVPQLESFLFAHRASEKVSVIGIDIDDSAPNAAAFMSRTGVTWPAIEDANGAISQQYGVDGPPQAYLINPKGIVVDRVLSGVTAQGLDELIAADMNGSPSSLAVQQ